jgi:hypothetical protein
VLARTEGTVAVLADPLVGRVDRLGALEQILRGLTGNERL